MRENGRAYGRHIGKPRLMRPKERLRPQKSKKLLRNHTNHARWRERDLSSWRTYPKRTPTCAVAVLPYNGREAVKLDERRFAIPAGKLLE